MVVLVVPRLVYQKLSEGGRLEHLTQKDLVGSVSRSVAVQRLRMNDQCPNFILLTVRYRRLWRATLSSELKPRRGRLSAKRTSGRIHHPP